MPDTEDKDSAAETFWPEGYKQVIREVVRPMVGVQLNGGKKLRHIYQQQYSDKYTDLNEFTNKVAEMVVIGAENGADDAFDDIISSFLTQSPLPEERKNARYLWPQALSQRDKKRLRQVIIDEYSQDDVYVYAYKVGYKGSYRGLGGFISRVAQLVVTGAMNGADDIVESIYRSFMTHSPLPASRRHPRRLKTW